MGCENDGRVISKLLYAGVYFQQNFNVVVVVIRRQHPLRDSILLIVKLPFTSGRY